MNSKHFLGAVCLLVGWGLGTLVHELCHLAGAFVCGVPATLGECTLSTGAVIIEGCLTPTTTAFIALTGSIGLLVAGVLMVKLSSRSTVKMIGVVFLCRAWIDVLPLDGFDGGLIAGSVGYTIAMIIVMIEVLICGSVIFDVLDTSQ